MIRIFMALAAQAGVSTGSLPPPVPAPPSPADPAGVQPLGNPGDWVTTADYPASALRGDVEGITAFALQVDNIGRVTTCRVTVSSGSDTLDFITCQLVKQRARFRPATDRRGDAVPGTYSNRVRWVIPKDIDPPATALLVQTFMVETDGTVTDCRTERAEGAAAKVSVGPMSCPPEQLSKPFLDSAGVAVRRLVRTTQQIEIEPAPSTAIPQP